MITYISPAIALLIPKFSVNAAEKLQPIPVPGAFAVEIPAQAAAFEA